MIDYTEDQAITQLRALMLWALPGISVVQGQQNMVPMPTGNFIILTPLHLSALGVSTRTYDRSNSLGLSNQGKDWHVQIDCYGETAADMASTIATLFRSPAATEWMEQYATDNNLSQRLQILYADDARNMPFINEASNYEWRWSLDVHLHINQTVSTPQQFAEQLAIGTVEVDTSLNRLN